MEREILVLGHAEHRAQPDRANLHITVEALGGDRDRAFRDAARLVEAVDAAVEAHRAALERSASASLVVQPRTRWHKGQSVPSGWVARRTSTLEVADFSALGQLVADVAAAGGAVQGPAWHLSPTSTAHHEARRQAAEDARRRADDYAAALGLSISGVAWVAEPGLRSSVKDTWMQAGGPTRAAAMGGGGALEDVVIEAEPPDLTLVATVEVGFTLIP